MGAVEPSFSRCVYEQDDAKDDEGNTEPLPHAEGEAVAVSGLADLDEFDDYPE